jgi:O-antigen/teichoic acid export membrane protein
VQTGRRVLKNIMALVFSTSMQRLLTFVLTVYVARALGADALGQFSIVMSLLLIFQTISYIGQEQIVIREVARAPHEAGAYLVNGSLLVVAGGMLGTLLMFVTASILDYESQVMIYIYFAGLSLIPGALAIVAESVIKGLEQMHFVTVAQTITGVIRLCLSLVLLCLGVDLWSIFLVIALSNMMLYLEYLYIVRRLVGSFVFLVDRRMIRHLLHLAGAFIVVSIFGVVFRHVDVLMLGKMKDSTTVGIYSAAFRLTQMGMQFRPAFMLALFPRMSEVYTHSPAQLGEIAERSLRLLMTFIIPIAVVVTFLAEEMIVLFYDTGYQESVHVLRLLAWGLVLFFANAVLYRTLLASDNEQVTVRVAGVNMISNVLLNLLLIPRWGVNGVAVASICTTLFALVQNYAYVARHLFKLDWLRSVGKPVLAAALCGGLLLALRGLPVVLSLSFGGTAYVVTVLILGVFSSKELEFVRRTWADARARIGL